MCYGVSMKCWLCVYCCMRCCYGIVVFILVYAMVLVYKMVLQFAMMYWCVYAAAVSVICNATDVELYSVVYWCSEVYCAIVWVYAIVCALMLFWSVEVHEQLKYWCNRSTWTVIEVLLFCCCCCWSTATIILLFCSEALNCNWSAYTAAIVLLLYNRCCYNFYCSVLFVLLVQHISICEIGAYSIHSMCYICDCGIGVVFTKRYYPTLINMAKRKFSYAY